MLKNDIPRCSRCGESKPDNQLNGYDPFAPAGQKYAKAYCIKIAECKSSEAECTIKKVLDEFKDTPDYSGQHIEHFVANNVSDVTNELPEDKKVTIEDFCMHYNVYECNGPQEAEKIANWYFKKYYGHYSENLELIQLCKNGFSIRIIDEYWWFAEEDGCLCLGTKPDTLASLVISTNITAEPGSQWKLSEDEIRALGDVNTVSAETVQKLAITALASAHIF